MNFRCECCDFTGKTNQSLTRHLNTNKHRDKYAELCSEITNPNNPLLNETMKEVNKRLNFFEKKMNALQEQNEALHEQNRALQEQNKSLHEQNEIQRKQCEFFQSRIQSVEKQLSSFVEKTSHNYRGPIGSIHNGDVNYHIHVNLAKYGTESYPDDLKALTDAIKGVNKAIPSLVKLRHFDPRHPENQNIKIPNKKHNKIQVYDGTRWITEDKRMTIEDKLQEYTNFMDTDEGQEIYNSCSAMIKDKLDKLTNFCDKVHSGDKLNREEQRELKRITGDVENIILDHQKK